MQVVWNLIELKPHSNSSNKIVQLRNYRRIKQGNKFKAKSTKRKTRTTYSHRIMIVNKIHEQIKG